MRKEWERKRAKTDDDEEEGKDKMNAREEDWKQNFITMSCNDKKQRDPELD